MKPGTRALGIAESFDRNASESTLAGAVVRADGILDGAIFGRCAIGGLDGTEAVIDCWERLERPDVRHLFLGAIAPAWYNLLDLEAIASAVDRPVIAVTFEESDGLEDGIRDAFSGSERARRLERYRALPPRHPLDLDGETVYFRAVGLERERAERLVASFTSQGGRPEPIRVARVLARAGDGFVRSLE
ncbi:DUF99 family protein [Halobacteria archaeon AArc-curdl1]|uniref:UPF0215 protein OB919_19285 n=1 Tax=Natronosalvus hydrolyticus TaxID=2979988 RepID=A0AAP2ZBC2_9EURY|nr:DUF99 family protein [Halobacteria archaeon AArc-curdl1]